MVEKFDKNNPNWRECLNWNFAFLRNAENYLNLIRIARGYLYLRDVYEYLGLPCSLDTIRKKHLNNILWTAERPFELEIWQQEDYVLIGFLNGINETKD